MSASPAQLVPAQPLDIHRVLELCYDGPIPAGARDDLLAAPLHVARLDALDNDAVRRWERLAWSTLKAAQLDLGRERPRTARKRYVLRSCVAARRHWHAVGREIVRRALRADRSALDSKFNGSRTTV